MKWLLSSLYHGNQSQQIYFFIAASFFAIGKVNKAQKFALLSVKSYPYFETFDLLSRIYHCKR
jgi:hypothetical protein